MNIFLKFSLLAGVSGAAIWAAGYLYPTSAAAQDQSRSHSGTANFMEIRLNRPEAVPGPHRLPAIERVVSSLDSNSNGVNDTDDIIAGGRLEVQRRPLYKSAYYRGGYPPENEGVCTDLVWRAFQQAGYDLKALIDADIKANVSAYPRTNGKPDPHIDFRRVPNQRIFFQRHGLTLTNEVLPNDPENLAQWQPGDIVTFTNPDHIAILSTIRNDQGIPYLIHNDGPWAKEEDAFMAWRERGLTGHFRFPKK